MASPDPHAALAESRRLQQQTIEAGSAPWPWPAMLACAATFVAFGVCIDVDMVWLGAVLLGVGAATAVPRAVRLRRAHADRSTETALAGVFVLALAVDVAVQFAARAADLAVANTLGCAAAAAVVLALARPIQARRATSRPWTR